MTELKPCPFCGGEARIKTWCDRFGNWNANVYCINAYGKSKEERCQAEFFMRSDTQEKVIEEITSKWNNRTSSWHTGTPTEEGWYLLKMVDEYGRITYGTNYLRNGIKGMEWKYAFFGHVIIKWQSIEDEPEVMMG